MGRRPIVPVSATPKVTITRDRHIVTATSGKHRRESMCASPSAAKNLEKQLANDTEAAALWVREKDPEQLDLPLVGRNAGEVGS